MKIDTTPGVNTRAVTSAATLSTKLATTVQIETSYVTKDRTTGRSDVRMNQAFPNVKVEGVGDRDIPGGLASPATSPFVHAFVREVATREKMPDFIAPMSMTLVTKGGGVGAMWLSNIGGPEWVGFVKTSDGTGYVPRIYHGQEYEVLSAVKILVPSGSAR